MKIVITGATGLLGKALIKTAPKDIDMLLTYHTNIPDESFDYPDRTGLVQWSELDLKSCFGLGTIKNFNPDIIIHCAAIGSVDYSQNKYNNAIKINLRSTLDIIEVAKSIKSKIILTSTNAVFKGDNGPYDEEGSIAPVNYYGIFKAAAELAVRGSGLDWMVIRPILMYGWPNKGRRGNWASIWIERLKEGKESLVVNDTVTQPLYNIDCASVIWKAIRKNKFNEIFNVASRERMTLCQFALKVCDVIGANRELIKPVPSSYFPSIAPRPVDTTYHINKIVSELGIEPVTVEEGIRLMLESKDKE